MLNRLARIALTGLLAVGAAAPPRRPPPNAETAEAATAQRLSALRGDPLLLRTFLHEMPKGGDLHSHLSGAVYAESYLRWAADDQLCVSTVTLAIVPCNGTPGQMSATARSIGVFRNCSTKTLWYAARVRAGRV